VADVKTDLKLIPWPSPQDYNEAIQNLAANSEDAQLQSGEVHATALGLPRSVTGAFASVYRVACEDTDVAVRCFLRDISDQEARYKQISDFVQNDSLPYTVSFNFMPKGIRVGNDWFPALKMDWVEGTNLDFYVEQNLGSPAIANLAVSLKKMCGDLREAGIAHGDLQHGNIIVCGGELRLVDYDGMYVPSMSGMLANELGHRNYQHPLRTAEEFGPHLDNFSSWVIYTSLRAVSIDNSLWELLGGGDDCLLFRRDDFVEPEHSYSFAVLEHHPNEEVRALAKFLRWQCHNPVREVPPLSDEIPAPPSFIGDLTSVITKTKSAPRTFARARTDVVSAKPNLPEWIDGNAAVSAVVSARQRPKPPPSRVQSRGIDPELLKGPPRHAVPRHKLTIPWTAAFHRFLVEKGTAVVTESLDVFESNDGFGNTKYQVRYSFRSPRNQRLIEVFRPLTQRDHALLAGLREATVLCDFLEPEMRNYLYELLEYRAATPIIPTGIERELKPPVRKVKFREDRFVSPAIVNLVLAVPMAASMAAAFAMGAAFAAVAIVFWMSLCIYLATSTHSHRDLVSKGIPARATVHSVLDVTGGGRMIEYTFMSVQGKINSSVEATAGDMACQKGDVITVLYDLENPKKNVPYRLAQYTAE
jgi:hypothetical protein